MHNEKTFSKAIIEDFFNNKIDKQSALKEVSKLIEQEISEPGDTILEPHTSKPCNEPTISFRVNSFCFDLTKSKLTIRSTRQKELGLYKDFETVLNKRITHSAIFDAITNQISKIGQLQASEMKVVDGVIHRGNGYPLKMLTDGHGYFKLDYTNGATLEAITNEEVAKFIKLNENMNDSCWSIWNKLDGLGLKSFIKKSFLTEQVKQIGISSPTYNYISKKDTLTFKITEINSVFGNIEAITCLNCSDKNKEAVLKNEIFKKGINSDQVNAIQQLKNAQKDPFVKLVS